VGKNITDSLWRRYFLGIDVIHSLDLWKSGIDIPGQKARKSIEEFDYGV
jgi:hypothetical protein